ncbi:MAG: pyridoxal 5'-phosphate synthase lyase subunit PdxS, partial [Candidatus Thermoplasmatota archaeon]
YATAIVEAVNNWQDAEVVASVSKGLGDAMKGEEIDKLAEKLQIRGL